MGSRRGLYLRKKAKQGRHYEGSRRLDGALQGAWRGRSSTAETPAQCRQQETYGQDTATIRTGLVQEGGEIIRERISTRHQCVEGKNIFNGLTKRPMAELESG